MWKVDQEIMVLKKYFWAYEFISSTLGRFIILKKGV